MSTRSVTHFTEFQGESAAMVYRHPDGYPDFGLGVHQCG